MQCQPYSLLFLNDEEVYVTWLSILKLDELNVHPQILCFRLMARVCQMMIIYAIISQLKIIHVIE